MRCLLVCIMSADVYHHAEVSCVTVNYPPSKTSFIWTADAVHSTGYGREMYFALEYGQSYSCTGCVYRSPRFKVLTTNEEPKSTAASSSSTATSSASTSQSSSTGGKADIVRTSTSATPTSSNNRATKSAFAAAAAGKTTAQQATDSRNRKIGLGVGLGVGLFAVFAVLGVVFFFFRRRQRKRGERESQHRSLLSHHSYRPTSNGNWAEEVLQPQLPQLPQIPQMREEPAIHDFSAVGTKTQSLHSGISGPSKSMRSSYAPGHTSWNTPDQTSWIEPFEFERPQMPEKDSTSQLRRSIHEDRSLRPDNASSTYSLQDDRGVESPAADAAAVISPSGRPHLERHQSERSFSPATDLSTLEGLPAQPQPVRTDTSQIVDWRSWPLEQ